MKTRRREMLVVDDDAMMRDLIAGLLEESGHSVHRAPSAEVAETKLHEFKIELALLDISLPGKSGIDLLQSIVTSYPTSVIMLTGITDLEVAVEAMRVGASDYIAKPFSPAVVRASVSRALERRDRELRIRAYRDELEIMVSERTKELEVMLARIHHTYDQTIFALGEALDLRDTETETHCARVAAIAVRLARELGVEDDERLRHLRWGAYLHDIGKIGVPDAILKKPGPLTEAEYLAIRKHPETGARMIRRIPFLRDAAEVVRYHHERYDGTGYPDGLSGSSIPLFARVFSVADAADAIVSERPYRAASDWAAVRAELGSQSGSQFDPGVVDAFLGVRDAVWAEIITVGHISRRNEAS